MRKRRKQFSPIYVPIALSVLAGLVSIGLVIAFFVREFGVPSLEDLRLFGWGGDIGYILIFILFLLAVMYEFRWCLLAFAVIWGTYGVVMGFRWCRKKYQARYPGRPRKPRKRRVTGRTPEEEIWFDER